MRFLRNLTLAALSLVLTITCAFPGNILALDREFYSGNDILYYDPNAVECTTATSGPLVGNDNAEIIYKYFVNKGLTGEQAAGIMGNMSQESTAALNPRIIEGGANAPDDYVPVHGTGFGLVQWTWSDRQQPLVDLAKSSNRKVTDIEVQLDYVWQELSGKFKHTLDALKVATNPVDAAIVVHGPPMPGYEASADSPEKVRSVRGGNATAYFEKYKSLTPTAVSGSDNCQTGKPSGNYISDFTFFNQCNPEWGEISTPTGRACNVSCGPTSVAMAVKNMTGQSITPKDTIEYVNSTNQWLPGGGTSFETTIQTAAKWGLKGEVMKNPKDINAYKEVLEKGGLIIAAGQGAIPFVQAPEAHFVIIRGIDSDGKFIIADPYPKTANPSDTNDKPWDTNQIIGATFGAVALTK
jgi:predicted double-glycine peptidase